ncbi:MAG: NADPH dehydrogenase [Alphaproteobacteria bacterium MarineAlpha9_Bin4]|nr:NADH:flavin oxidoreductase / NADH oxidase [Pelagibacterales bacterium]PPR25509.1 MAG: NADPH dehydrogenase [Alphaproteobacteria bacterium MarineAlpha9_Bin4]
MKTKLFSKISIRGVTSSNRIVLSPLCMYSANNGVPNDWHFSHLSTYARAGVGIVFTEATAVQEIGRITPYCCGLWNDKQAQAYKKIASFIRSMGSIPAIQLAHAGRKASAKQPWKGGTPLDIDNKEKDQSSWNTVAPSSIAVSEGWKPPSEMNISDINKLINDYVDAAKRAIFAGFQIIEIHAAHGYLLHSFLSPISNKRNDNYGGSHDGRIKLLKEIIIAIRKNIPNEFPIFCRISAIDGLENGWSIKDSVKLSKILKSIGVDVIDCSSGGIIGRPRFAVNEKGEPLKKNTDRGLGFQVPLAEEIRKNVGIKTMAVGVIINPIQAEEILDTEQADLIAMGRELMYNPFWPLHAAQELKVDPNFEMWPNQYRWAVNRRSNIKKFKEIS